MPRRTAEDELDRIHRAVHQRGPSRDEFGPMAQLREQWQAEGKQRVTIRLGDELAEALDALLPKLAEETEGLVRDRATAARYLLAGAVSEQGRTGERQRQVDDLIDQLDNEEMDHRLADERLVPREEAREKLDVT